jgi:hypothetical protein
MLSSDSTYYCPACGSAMENVKSTTAEVVSRCALCAQTWTITTSAECHAILTAWKNERDSDRPPTNM